MEEFVLDTGALEQAMMQMQYGPMGGGVDAGMMQMMAGLWAGVTIVLAILLLVLIVVPLCKMFTKMGNNWYEALINGHNAYVLITKAGKPGWWFFLFFLGVVLMVIPLIGWVAGIIIMAFVHFSISIGLAKKFGKSTGFGVGMAILPFIFFPILGYGSAKYSK